MERHNGIELDPEGAFVYYDDAQATVEALQRERDALKLVNEMHMKTVMKLSRIVEQNGAALDAEREKVKGLHEITKVICTHCCEPMEIPSKAVLQTQLTQLQALVWDVLRTFDYLTFHRVAGMDVLLYESHNRTSPERTVEATARRIRATLNATTPAPMGSNILEEDIGKAMMRSKGGDGE